MRMLEKTKRTTEICGHSASRKKPTYPSSVDFSPLSNSKASSIVDFFPQWLTSIAMKASGIIFVEKSKMSFGKFARIQLAVIFIRIYS